MMHVVAVVGIGEDGLAGLRADARHALDNADVLVGGTRQQQLVPDHAAERLVFTRDAVRLAAEVERLADSGRRVVVLASGDPMYFGIGTVLAERLGERRVRTYPNVSAVQLAFARLGLAWQDALVLSAHGRPLDPVVDAALGSAKVAILTDHAHTPAAIAHALLEAGMEPIAQVWCLERLGGPAERIQHGALRDCASWTADPLNILVVRRDPRSVRGPAWSIGLPEDTYAHERGQITKSDVRVLSLARLALRGGDTVWDVGAGSGALSIEAARLCAPTGTVFAVEQQPDQQACIRENARRHRTSNIELIAGDAPRVLAGLPDPDAIFVGGSGGQLDSIVETSLARLRPAGRLVLNMATLESVTAASRALKKHTVPFDLMQVSIARGSQIGDGMRLAPLNPVFIVWARLGHAE